MQGKNEENAVNRSRRLAQRQKYVSPNQLTIPGFETPFEQKLTKENRWVKLASLIPWDSIVGLYNKQFHSKEGRPPINGRIVLGAVIIKHMLNITDRETIDQIKENMFMQYFLGYSGFTNEEPFDSSLFVDIRNRLDIKTIEKINDLIVLHHIELATSFKSEKKGVSKTTKESDKDTDNHGANPSEKNEPENKG